MGESNSKQANEPLAIEIDQKTTQITFSKHRDAKTQDVKFYNGHGPADSFKLTKENTSRTIFNLIPDTPYEYSFETDSSLFSSNVVKCFVKTLSETVASDVNLQKSTGPFEAIFSVSEREIKTIEKVAIRVFHNSDFLKSFELTNTQRFFSLTGLEPATLYTYYWTTFEKEKDKPSQEIRGEFYTKKLKDLAVLFKDETRLREERTKLLDFLSNFKPPTGEKYVNIAVIGRIGSGKSSFINSVSSALADVYTPKANAGTSDTSLTQEVRYYRLPNTTGVALVDLFGLDVSKPDMHTKIIKPLFEGEVPSNFKLSAFEKMIEEDQEYKQTDTDLQKKEMRKISAILFIVEHQCLDNKEITGKIASYFTYVQKQGIPFTVVCTQIDTLFSNESLQMKDIFTSPKVCERMDFFAECLGKTFSSDNIYPFVNYQAYYEKGDLAKDVLSLKILSNLARSGATYLRNKADDEEFS